MIVRLALGNHTACERSVLNSDVGGIGVLFGIYAPIPAITFALALGHRTSRDTGTKELGCVVLMSK